MSARTIARKTLMVLLVALIVAAIVWTAAFGTVGAPT
jgi:preprotein translocase subunit SecE